MDKRLISIILAACAVCLAPSCDKHVPDDEGGNTVTATETAGATSRA